MKVKKEKIHNTKITKIHNAKDYKEIHLSKSNIKKTNNYCIEVEGYNIENMQTQTSIASKQRESTQGEKSVRADKTEKVKRKTQVGPRNSSFPSSF